MIILILILPAMVAAVLVTLMTWRWADHKADNTVWSSLVSHQPKAPETFDPVMVNGLPDPSRRFFRYTIRPQTPLYTVAEISMEGEFSLGSKAEPNYLHMRAEQILEQSQR